MTAPGFFGKLPDRGDFVERRLPPTFASAWDQWMQSGIAASQVNLGDQWLETYLTSPVWRFALARHIVDENAYAGVMMPSVDKVGRYFPLCVAVPLDSDESALGIIERAAAWYLAVEPVLLGVLDEPPLPFDQFDRRIEDLAWDELNDAGGLQVAANGIDARTHWNLHFTLPDPAAQQRAYARMAGAFAEQAGGPCSVWQTRGSDAVSPSLAMCRGLPGREQFTSLLSGEWSSRYWLSQDLAAADPHGYGLSLVPVSASVSDRGKVREINEDSLAARDVERIWLLADGLGGHDAGSVASSMAAGVVDHIPGDASIELRIDALRAALGVVQGNLHQMTQGIEHVNQTATTVVALLVDDASFACAWAGDSRLYRLRNQSLEQLTRDHAEFDPATGRSVLTRAVGGDDPLQLDVLYGEVHAGDRFLLCSDGVYQMLTSGHLRDLLIGRSAQESCDAISNAVLESEATDNFTALIVDFPDFATTYVPLVTA